MREEPSPAVVPSPTYRSYDQMATFLDNMYNNCPSISRLYSVGTSVQGRELFVMQMTQTPRTRRSLVPQFKYVGNMHGDEVVGREMLLNLIEYFCTQYGVDPNVTSLLDTTDIHILPSMNPDGYELGTRANANGVDLNRNFPGMSP
jgi:carboxypeptidase D